MERKRDIFKTSSYQQRSDSPILNRMKTNRHTVIHKKAPLKTKPATQSPPHKKGLTTGKIKTARPRIGLPQSSRDKKQKCLTDRSGGEKKVELLQPQIAIQRSSPSRNITSKTYDHDGRDRTHKDTKDAEFEDTLGFTTQTERLPLQPSNYKNQQHPLEQENDPQIKPNLKNFDLKSNLDLNAKKQSAENGKNGNIGKEEKEEGNENREGIENEKNGKMNKFQLNFEDFEDDFDLEKDKNAIIESQDSEIEIPNYNKVAEVAKLYYEDNTDQMERRHSDHNLKVILEKENDEEEVVAALPHTPEINKRKVRSLKSTQDISSFGALLKKKEQQKNEKKEMKERKFDTKFNKMYADLHYNLMTKSPLKQMKKLNKRAIPDQSPSMAGLGGRVKASKQFENEINQISSKSAEPAADPINKAMNLMKNVQKYKGKGKLWYSKGSFEEYQVHFDFKEEKKDFREQNTFGQGVYESPRRGGEESPGKIKDFSEIFDFKLTHSVGEKRSIFIDNYDFNGNQLQHCSTNYYSRKNELAPTQADDIFQFKKRKPYSNPAEINLSNVKLASFWETQKIEGKAPDIEFGTLVNNGNRLYFYGKNTETDAVTLTFLNTEIWKWAQLDMKGEEVYKHYGESVNLYKDKLIIYGGTTNKPKKPNYSEVRTLDLKRCMVAFVKIKSTAVTGPPLVPLARTNHGSVIINDKLWIYGGLSVKHTQPLNDLWVFDLKTLMFSKLKTVERVGLFLPEPLLFMSMTPVFHSRVCKENNKLLNLGIVRDQKLNNYNMGIYIFGGMKANKLASNELYYFRTGSRASREIQFEPDNIECFKPNIAGKAPISRSHHSAIFISNKYLLIYGGKNINLKEKTGKIDVNDVALLNLNYFQWEIVACSGFHPEGRWLSSIEMFDNKILIFGGNTRKGYTDTSVHLLETNYARVQALLVVYNDLIAKMKAKGEVKNKS